MTERHREYARKRLREEKDKERAARPAAAGKAATVKPDPSPPAKPAADVPAFYDALSGGFLTANGHGEYQKINAGILGMHLQAEGFNGVYKDEQGLTQVERKILEVVQKHGVHYAGPLGGFAPGYCEMNSSRLLVTTGPKFLTPAKGEWPTFRIFLDQLLGEQARYFCAWIRCARQSLDRGIPWGPGQVLCLAGPPGCGKSFLQTLITLLLGGRVSKPYAYLTGRTDFNADIFAAEHALIGDEVPQTDLKSRRNFGSAIKAMVANKEQHIHPKGKQPFTLTPFLRVSISLNDNAESLMVLPPLDGDVRDKLILLKASPIKFPWPSKRFPDSQTYYRKLVSELPAFLHSLRRWRIPESIQCQRYGVTSWLNPELVREVDAMSPELRLWELIDTMILEGIPGADWTGTASQLEGDLREIDREKKTRVTEGLFSYHTACGQYLGRLADKMPHAISVKSAGGRKKVYKIVRPLEE